MKTVNRYLFAPDADSRTISSPDDTSSTRRGKRGKSNRGAGTPTAREVRKFLKRAGYEVDTLFQRIDGAWSAMVNLSDVGLAKVMIAVECVGGEFVVRG